MGAIGGMLNRSIFIKNKYTFLYPAAIVFIGLMVAQLIATLQVYLSNAELYQTLFLLKSHGYFIVPNPLVMDQLCRFKPAFMGGLFFSFTIGAGVCIFTFGVVWSWLHILNKNKITGFVFVLIWATSIVAANRKGFCPIVTLYFLIIPVLISMIMMKWDKRSKRSIGSMKLWGPVFSIILLAILWTTQMSSSMFLDIRDNLLFSNAIGSAFNDFYYKYTLYPAGVFKSLDQKMLKTCRLTIRGDKKTEITIEKLLLFQDYLRITDPKPVDLDISGQGDILVFYNERKPLLSTTCKAFMSDPNHFLEMVSLKTDRYGFFRQVTFIGLLVGFPLVLFIFIYSLLGFICSFFIGDKTASVLSSILCVLIGISTFLIFNVNKSTLVDKIGIPSALTSDRWQDRISALKTIIHYKIEINPTLTDPDIVNDPHIAVRYWLAKALAISRKNETYPPIVSLLNDPQPNVVCMALEALASRRDKNIIGLIIKKIETTDHWYIQWYAYRTLRKLGWTQTGSI